MRNGVAAFNATEELANPLERKCSLAALQVATSATRRDQQPNYITVVFENASQGLSMYRRHRGCSPLSWELSFCGTRCSQPSDGFGWLEGECVSMETLNPPYERTYLSVCRSVLNTGAKRCIAVHRQSARSPPRRCEKLDCKAFLLQ